jgi:glycosyltransferase involved in cell wall biosynthesis
MVKTPPTGYRVEPVYFDGTVHRYARRFARRYLSLPAVGSDDVVDFCKGDTLLGLDLDLLAVPSNAPLYQKLRALGVKVWFVVYDILCVRMPQHFVGPMEQYFKDWLPVIGLADGLACISQAVADDVREWYYTHPLPAGRLPEIKAFHLGSDFASPDAKTAAERANSLTTLFGGRPTFLMVGTIESRKGHRQVLNAFDAMWKTGKEINLALVGKAGWLVDDVVARLRHHPAARTRLFWFEGPSDEQLVAIYEASTCLIAASEGEGFGLPLVEAAHFGIPILARDLPVFREVVGDSATYFSGYSAGALESALLEWLERKKTGSVPTPQATPLSWRESTEQLTRIVVGPL